MFAAARPRNATSPIWRSRAFKEPMASCASGRDLPDVRRSTCSANASVWVMRSPLRLRPCRSTKTGNIGLGSVAAVSEDHTGYYVRRVCAALSSSLTRDFRYPIGAAAKSALEDPGPQPDYPRELRNFRVTEIRVTNDALVLVVDFELTVK